MNIEKELGRQVFVLSSKPSTVGVSSYSADCLKRVPDTMIAGIKHGSGEQLTSFCGSRGG